MKEEKTINKTVEIIEVVSTKITCDKCGKEEEYKDYDATSITPINIDFGYGSKFDTNNWNMDLCDSCIEDFIISLKNPPKGFLSNYIPQEILNKRTNEQLQLIFNDWKEKKDSFDWLDWVSKEEITPYMERMV
jgi:hypothetical protein